MILGARVVRHILPIACGYATSVAVYSRLPASLDAPALVPLRPFTAFMLPTAAAITTVLLHVLWQKDVVRRADEAAASACRAIGFRALVFVMAIHVLAMANLAGVVWLRPWAPRMVVVLFGALLMSVGNLLPRTRPNLLVGLRTTSTLTDRGLWIRVHRAAGYALVGVGTVLTLSGLFLTRPLIALVINAAFVAGASYFAISYRHHARVNG